jgi:SAM-dependent MidA family methyltransferase
MRVDQGIHAGRCAAEMAAGLERHIDRRTAQLACRFDTVPQILWTSRFITNEVVDAMPFSVFMRTEGVSLTVTQRVAEHISASLGDDDQVWETLNALAPDFTGSIAELVEVVSKV